MSEHSPLPWKTVKIDAAGEPEIADATGRPIAVNVYRANADYIITAANAHEALVEACKDVLSKIDDCADGKINFRRDFADRVRAALAKAGVTDA